MSLSLDHVVIAVTDLDRATADYADLGFTVLQGGQHGDGATHNALIVLQDGAYIELIAFRPQADNRWSRVYRTAGEGFLDFALLPSAIDTVVGDAVARGLDIGPTTDGSRLRPDGERLAWKIARTPRADLPFLCGDVTPRALRVQEGEARIHPNGITGIAEVSVAVEDADASLARYQALLGPTVPASRDGAGMPGLTLGETTIRLVSRQTAGVAEALDARGERLFAVTFRAPSGTAQPIDPAKTHGARLTA